MGAAGYLRAADAPALPLKVSENRRYLVDQKGHPFLIHGDTAWSLITAVTKEEAVRYLDDRRDKGFDAIIVNLIEHFFNGPIDRDGEGPFTTPAISASRTRSTLRMPIGFSSKPRKKALSCFCFPCTWVTKARMKVGTRKRF